MNNAWAVVTGASSGLGVAFADRIASEGVGVVLVARREDKLREVAADLRRRRGVDTDVVAADLSTQEGVQKVIDAMEGRELAYLVNNAGRPIGRMALLEAVFDIPGDSDIETKTLEKHIWVLRQKLEPDPRNPQYIVNVRGVGYKFEGD